MMSTAVHQIPLVVIAGPTASGKSSVALKLAEQLDAEIVSADSMQVYRGLDIGTAKPTVEEQHCVPHHLIDIVNPDESYDAACFLTDADAAIQQIHARNRLPLVVGGTGLYIRALLHGLHEGPPPNPEIREQIKNRAASAGWPALHAELSKFDPQTAKRLHPNDGVRVLRALEVLKTSGVSMSSWQIDHGFTPNRYPFLLLAIQRPRPELHYRINTRVDQMMDQGFLSEVQSLIKKGYGPDLKPMQGLGYRRLCQYIGNEIPLEDAIEHIKTDTRRFSKRQNTWVKREPDLIWVAPDTKKIFDKIEIFRQPETLEQL